METLDIGYNNHKLLGNDFQLRATQGQFGKDEIGVPQYYDAIGDQPLLLKLTKKYGGNPTLKNGKLYLDNNVTIPLRDETFGKTSPETIKEIEALFQDWRADPLELNQKAANILSKNGKKVIKYHNRAFSEMGTGDNTSYMITDPHVFHVPNRDALNIGKKIFGVSKQGVLGYGISKQIW